MDTADPNVTGPLPQAEPAFGVLVYPVYLFGTAAVLGAVVINGLAVALVRVWNPSRETQPRREEEASRHEETVWGVEHDLAVADIDLPVTRVVVLVDYLPLAQRLPVEEALPFLVFGRGRFGRRPFLLGLARAIGFRHDRRQHDKDREQAGPNEQRPSSSFPTNVLRPIPAQPTCAAMRTCRALCV